jgi:hypothetical protein
MPIFAKFVLPNAIAVQWISTRTKPPVSGQTVIFFVPDDNCQYLGEYVDEGKRGCWFITPSSMFAPDEVSHWYYSIPNPV